VAAPAAAAGAQAAGAVLPTPDDDDSSHKWLWSGAALLALLLFLLLMQSANRSRCGSSGEGGGADESGLTADQVAARVENVGEEMGLSPRYILAAFATVLVESGGGTTMTNPMCYLPHECNGTSVGAFQQQDFSPWTGNGRNRRNVSDAARTFYEQAIKDDRPGYSIGQLAQAVQQSAFPSKYDEALPVAERFYNRISGLSPQRFASLLGTTGSPQAIPVIGPGRIGIGVPPVGVGLGVTGRIVWPVGSAANISEPFGAVDETHARPHTGLDIAVTTGTPIKAALGGKIALVESVDQSGGYGNFTCISHTNDYTTCYAHQSVQLVRVGQVVAQGQTIGLVGSTGFSTGPHLHFEVRRRGPVRGAGELPCSLRGTAYSCLNPLPFLQGKLEVTGVAAEGEGSEETAAQADCGPPSDGRPPESPPTEAPAGVPVTLLSAPSGPAVPNAGFLLWPATIAATVITHSNARGTTHDPNTWPPGWQSDNAIDLAMPVGTPILAVDDGVVCASCGFGRSASSSPQLAGLRFTLETGHGNEVFYQHLSRLVVTPGERVRRGQVVGYSGEANGVAHLHIAVRDGVPEAMFGLNGPTTTGTPL
jgi:murein DD-endopeptidase MepM/ murein hydrolase activator NlpD